MKRIVVVIAALLGALSVLAEYAQNSIADLALIYQGGTHRPEWVADEVEPYVVHKYADGTTDWLFDGFLVFEYTSGGIAFSPGSGSRNAVKSDWEWLLDRVFAQDKGIDALNACIEKYKPVLGAPARKHRLVLGLPSPIPKQTNWGELDGVALDFNNSSDRLKAVKWYIDQLMQRLQAASLQNLDLAGFYWIEELDSSSRDILNQVSDYIHSLGKQFYWIPYWASPGSTNWRNLGFDMAYQQPNHFFDKNILDARLHDACRVAQTYNMGLELEMDYRVFYERTDSYYSRLEAYLDAFEKYGVFAKSSVAYYTGTRAWLDMSLSDVPENHAIIDRIARHVASRRTELGGVDASNMDAVSVFSNNGVIYVAGEYADVAVYTVAGTLLPSSVIGESVLDSGVYVVVVDGKPYKVMVR